MMVTYRDQRSLVAAYLGWKRMEAAYLVWRRMGVTNLGKGQRKKVRIP